MQAFFESSSSPGGGGLFFSSYTPFRSHLLGMVMVVTSACIEWAGLLRCQKKILFL